MFQFGGYTLQELASLAGQTPCYIYDRAKVTATIENVKNTLPPSIELRYSLKANPYAPLVSHIAQYIDGFDIASHGEMFSAIGSGIDRSKISFSGPAKSDKELAAAITAGITLHMESAIELDRIAGIAQKLKRPPKISIRINPDFSVKQSGMVMGGGPQPFGVDVENIHQLITKMKAMNLECVGLHCYPGSQMLSADSVIEIQSLTIDLLLNIVRDNQLNNVFLNIGGGFGLPYFPGQTSMDLESVANALSIKISTADLDGLNLTWQLELGRFLVGEAGIYLCQVRDVKISRGVKFIITDGGMHHHLAASGNLGQVIRKNYPIQSEHGNDTRSDSEKVTITGPLCTPLDILAKDVLLPSLQIGDFIAVRLSGAYGYSASPHKFLGHPEPIELLV